MEEEIWKDIDGFEGLYAVSSLCRVKKYRQVINGKCYVYERPEKIIKQSSDGRYWKVMLHKNEVHSYRYVHRLAAIAFIPNPENKPQINHINGIKSDNRLENFEWSNASENGKHAFKMGLNKVSEYRKMRTSEATRGSLQVFAILKETDIPVIHKYKTLGMSNAEIAKLYKVHHQTIGAVVRGVTWKHVGITFDKPDLFSEKIKRSGVNYYRAYHLRAKGYSDEEAILMAQQPVKRRMYEYHGVFYNRAQLSRVIGLEFNIKPVTVRVRMDAGIPIEDLGKPLGMVAYKERKIKYNPKSAFRNQKNQ